MTQSKKGMTETSPKNKTYKTAADRKTYIQELEAEQKRFAKSQDSFKKVRIAKKTSLNIFRILIVTKMNCVDYHVIYSIVASHILD